MVPQHPLSCTASSHCSLHWDPLLLSCPICVLSRPNNCSGEHSGRNRPETLVACSTTSAGIECLTWEGMATSTWIPKDASESLGVHAEKYHRGETTTESPNLGSAYWSCWDIPAQVTPELQIYECAVPARKTTDTRLQPMRVAAWAVLISKVMGVGFCEALGTHPSVSKKWNMESKIILKPSD